MEPNFHNKFLIKRVEKEGQEHSQSSPVVKMGGRKKGKEASMAVVTINTTTILALVISLSLLPNTLGRIYVPCPYIGHCPHPPASHRYQSPPPPPSPPPPSSPRSPTTPPPPYKKFPPRPPHRCHNNCFSPDYPPY